MSELTEGVVYASYMVGCGLITTAVGLSVYNTIKEHWRAPGIVSEAEGVDTSELSSDDLARLYNRLLPASRRTFGKTRSKADELVKQVEHALCKHIAGELDEEGMPKGADVTSQLSKSTLFQDSFARHHYNRLNPKGALDHIVSVMDAQ